MSVSKRVILSRYRGVTLIELVVFLVIISVALVGLLSAYNRSVASSVDPIVDQRLLELAQSKLDEIIARKYDHNTPNGGIPACNTATGSVCAGIGREGAETCNNPGLLNDVDDFNGCAENALYNGNYARDVTVVFAGNDLGLADNSQAKRISVNVTGPNNSRYQLSSYRANF